MLQPQTLLCLGFGLGLISTTRGQNYPVKEQWFNQTVDHFNFQELSAMTFPQRYFVNDQHWDGSKVCGDIVHFMRWSQ